MPLKLEHVVVPRVLSGPGIELWFEKNGEGDRIAHVRVTDGSLLGKAGWLRQHIPRDTYITVPQSMQPAGGWWLRRYVGFVAVGQQVVEGELCDVLWRPFAWT